MTLWFSGEGGDGALDLIITERISNARTSVWIANFIEVRGPVAGQLAQLAARGLDLRVIMDAEASRRRRDWPPYFTQKRVEGGRVHHKFTIIDDAEVIAGSYNLGGGTENADFLMSITDSALVKRFADEFLRLEALPDLPEPMHGHEARELIEHTYRRSKWGMGDKFIREVERKFERRGFLTEAEVEALHMLRGKRNA